MATPKKMTDEEIKTLIKDIQAGKVDPANLTQDQLSDLTRKTTDFNFMRGIKNDLGVADMQETNALLTSYMEQAKSFPSYIQMLEDKKNRGELTERLSSGLNTLLNLSKVAVSASQIRKSNDQLSRLNRPALPSTPGEDPALREALYKAGQGTFDAARAAQVSEGKILNQRRAADQAIRQASRGQGGQFQAGMQANALGAMGAMGELTPMIDTIRAREQARYDELLGMRGRERQMDFRNRMSLFDVANENVNIDRASANMLGQAGRENLFSSLQGLGDNLAVAGGYNLPRYKESFRRTGNPVVDQANDTFGSNMRNAMMPGNEFFNKGAMGPQDQHGYLDSLNSGPRWNDIYSSDVRKLAPSEQRGDLGEPWQEAYRRMDNRIRTRR